MSNSQTDQNDALTPEEAKALRIALIFGDPALATNGQPDPRLEEAKRKLKAIESEAEPSPYATPEGVKGSGRDDYVS